MNRVVIAFGLAIVIVSAVGCFKFESHSVSGKDPGELTKDELQDKIAEVNKWKSVSLEEGENGVFAGTAITEGGEELKLVVHQSEKEIRTKWTDATGGGGGELTQSWSATRSVKVKFP